MEDAHLEGHGLIVIDNTEGGGVSVEGVEDLGDDGRNSEVSGLILLAKITYDALLEGFGGGSFAQHVLNNY